ncbi:FAD-dependent monooxygenase [Streptomyces sp. NBC_01261]|uniref:FAD-dependent oxidoreductase n=1 Tax=unclassified Streptomyces TaxID=2593676 RepID=UPI002E333667|nr:FAD-dependent monooxygenase [Streptomyces sp. NBC_01261]
MTTGRTAATVAVVGAGIGGLAAAISLRREGFRVELYEQASSMRENGTVIGNRSRTVDIIHSWGLRDAYEPLTLQIRTIRMVSGETGEYLGEIELLDEDEDPADARHHVIRRQDLQRLLASQLPAESIHLSHRCETIVDHGNRVEIRFTDGSVAHADAVVGADGIHSVVRRLLHSDRPVYCGMHSYPGVVEADRVRDLMPEGATSLMWQRTQGVGAFIAMTAHQGKYVGFDAVLPVAEAGDDSWRTTIPRDELVEKLDGFHPDVLEIVRRSTDTEVIAFGMHDREPIHDWTSNRITLLGDAAHPMLPAEGQGANLAIQDGAALGEFLRGADADGIPAALRRYSDARAPIAAAIQQRSRDLSPFSRLQN